MKNKKIAIFVSLCAAIALIPFLWTLDADACFFSLAAGKKTTVDGAVLFGHNEDDGGTLVTRLHLIPRQHHEPGEVIEMWDTGTIIPQVEVTYAFIWSEMPDFSFSDSYLNEWGVAIASDASGSKERSPHDLTQGGIKYWLRRLVAERARTAREGVLIMGEAIETYGSDKPDLRFGMEIVDLKEVFKNKTFGPFQEADDVRGFVIKGGNADGALVVDPDLGIEQKFDLMPLVGYH